MVSFDSLLKRKAKIAVVGLGYVGLPLAVHLSKHFTVVGYDLKSERVSELVQGHDRTLEIEDDQLRAAQVSFTDNPETLGECGLVIIAVPTPIDKYRIPDFTPLEGASESVGKHLKKGMCVVYESTVYPGATEEVCVPILERESGLTFGKDFTVGYSPERINPGDKVHTLEKITKIVSGSDQATLELLAQVYGKIVTAGVHRATSIKVAEAAKVIENTQRDLNIALMNELSMIFKKIGIDTLEVLEAAGTKWNFLPFRPGLVGGHCIGVDPYYLTFKAESLGYHPEMILAGRRINDNMGLFITDQVIKKLISAGRQVKDARVAMLGLTFKENVPDLRNTKVIDIIAELKAFGINVLVHDPLADTKEAKKYYDIELAEYESIRDVDAVIVAVIHDTYKEKGLAKIAALCSAKNPIVIDIKGAFDPAEAKQNDIIYWRL